MLNNIDWSKVTDICDVDKAWECFHSLFLQVLDKVAPLKVIRIKQRTQPWINNDILDTIYSRNKALSDFRKSNLPEFYVEYKALRNKAQRMVDEAKKDYFKTKIEEHRSDSKKLWATLKPLGTKEKPKHKQSKIGLTVNGSLSYDKVMVAERFNHFFTTIASDLLQKLPTNTGTFGEPEWIHGFYHQKGV